MLGKCAERLLSDKRYSSGMHKMTHVCKKEGSHLELNASNGRQKCTTVLNRFLMLQYVKVLCSKSTFFISSIPPLEMNMYCLFYKVSCVLRLASLSLSLSLSLLPGSILHV